ncbi:MAG: helix-turn-helix transcriptional regulator [Pseudomonadota bacterium]
MSDARDTDGSGAAAGNDRYSIGARLAAARQACELDKRVVANELKLDVSIIEALESDDRTALPAAIFVKGYLRNYARLVGLPEDEMVRDYAEQTGEPPPLTVVAIKGKTPFFQLPSARLLRNVILILLAVILIWLAYPFIERLVESRGQMTQEPVPGRLELPVNPQTTE